MTLTRSLALLFLFASSAFASGQATEPGAGARAVPAAQATPPPFVDPSTLRPKARPEDVSSIDAIIGAVYDVISGPAGPRDWERFKSLMLPEARLMPIGHRPDGQDVYRMLDADGYVQRASPTFLKDGFFESTVSNRIEQFGSLAHVFSTYESRREKGGAPFARGINSFQLVKLGDRWWVASIMWDVERPGVAIPAKYLGR